MLFPLLLVGLEVGKVKWISGPVLCQRCFKHQLECILGEWADYVVIFWVALRAQTIRDQHIHVVTLRCISILESTQIVGCFAGKPLGMRSTCGQFVACCWLLFFVGQLGFFCFNQNLDKKSFAMATSSVRIQICYDQALVCLFFVGRCHRRMHKGERGVQTHIQHSMNCEPCNVASWQAPNIWYNTLRIGKVWFSWPFLSHHCAVLRHTVGAQWGIWVLPRVWQGAGPFSASE